MSAKRMPLRTGAVEEVRPPDAPAPGIGPMATGGRSGSDGAGPPPQPENVRAHDKVADPPGSADCDPGFRPLMEISLHAEVLDSRWVYCDYLSSFVAEIVGHNRADPFRSSNLLSATINEILEVVHRTRKEPERLLFRILRNGPVDRITTVVPCGRVEQQFYERTVGELCAPDAGDQYLNMLFSEEDLDRRLGLFELAVLYKARFSAETVEGTSVRLTVDLSLEQETV